MKVLNVSTIINWAEIFQHVSVKKKDNLAITLGMVLYVLTN